MTKLTAMATARFPHHHVLEYGTSTATPLATVIAAAVAQFRISLTATHYQPTRFIWGAKRNKKMGKSINIASATQHKNTEWGNLKKSESKKKYACIFACITNFLFLLQSNEIHTHIMG